MRLDVRRAIVGALIAILWFGIGFPLLFQAAAVAMDHALGFPAMMSQAFAVILAAASLAVGLFWVLWSYSYLLFVGHGSPAEVFGRALHPTRQLVTVGPYAYTRNPMLLGYLWILLAIAFLLNSISAVILLVIMGFLATIYLRVFEEPGLVRRFGADYEHYREHVPMLIPRWRVYIKPESAAES